MNTPVESEESAVTEVPDGLERWLLDDEPETAGQAEPAVTEVPDLPEEPDVPEEADLPEVTEDAAEEEIPETLMPEEPEPNAEPEAEEAPAAVQGADSRVPPEARRMSAAPYGTAKPEPRRPGTRPQNAYRRPPMPEQKPVPVRPRRDVREAEPRASGGRIQDKTSRVRVGYAPGRMSDGMTQQVPVRETAREMNHEMNRDLNRNMKRDLERESYYSRDAKAYLEKRSQPFRTESSRGQAPDRPEHKLLRIIVALLVLAGIVITGLLILKDRENRKNVVVREVPRVASFEPTSAVEGVTAPQDLAFQAVTGKDVDEIRLRTEDDGDLHTEAIFSEDTDGRHWTMKMTVETGFVGTAVLQVRRAGTEEWLNTDTRVDVNVLSPLEMFTQKTEGTPEPDPAMYDDDYYDEDVGLVKASEEADGTGEDAEGEGAEGEGADAVGEDGEPEAEPEDNPEAGAEGVVTGDTWVEGEDEAPEGEPQGEGEAYIRSENDGEMPMGELRTPAPTATPAPPEVTATPVPPLTAEAAESADPGLISSTTVYTSYTKKEKNYSRPAKELIQMPEADEYTKQQLGVMTFRGDNFRRNAVVGTLPAAPTGLKVNWTAESGSVRGTSQTYYGYGWTGQPVIARWSKQVREGSNLFTQKIETEALKEVIIAGLDGNIRFLDLADGEKTRNSIKLGYPMRGTPTLHTRGYPFLSVGQFARKMKVKTGKIGLRQYNLYNQKEQKLLDGLDGKYHRPLNDVGSFETSALIDRNSDTLIVAGSNGMLYLEALNSSFDYNTKVLSISPSVTVMNYKVKGQKSTALLAVESSPAAYDKYVYMANMGGILQCIDTNNLKPVWAVNTGDSVMAAVALDLQGNEGEQAEAGEDADDPARTDKRELSLYTANMLNNRKKGDSTIQIRRYNALSGAEDWTTDIGVYKGKKDKDDVGAKASPIIGQHKLNDLVYFTVTGLSEDGRQKLGIAGEAPAALIALEKKTGSVVWAYGLSSRSESSPIAVYDAAGNGWVIQCEQNGTIHLLEGLTGRAVNTLKLEAEIEASPAAYGNMMVIGTTGKGTSNVYGIELELARAQEEEVGNEEDSGGA